MTEILRCLINVYTKGRLLLAGKVTVVYVNLAKMEAYIFCR